MIFGEGGGALLRRKASLKFRAENAKYFTESP